MENNYRIRTDVGSDTVLRVNLQQDYDFLEILSLKISQEDLYPINNSNYGIIVGRVLANDAFGIPNAKVSLFIPIDDADKNNTDLLHFYKYKDVTDVNDKHIRYNLLKDSSDDECYKVVGTFPNKRLVLDDNTFLEIFDKYYKYTTVTNNAGDYMIYGVPTGDTMLHVDLDLSDCGVLSQKPRDFMYKGYNETQFDNASQFKSSTNLDNLTQIFSQNQGVFVYPFFGEEGEQDIAITRCDIQIQYKFEPTCVFLGSIITDSLVNSIGCNCQPSPHVGQNSELVCGNGTIEMIRKTPDGLIEEYQILGNQLIDENGVWCYQIPMNLDYVGTDEFGNICPTDNPNKGIPTRTRVRFRISVNETANDSVSRHRAKYLVPNNPKIIFDTEQPRISACSTFDKHYEFGSNTQEDDFRNLYWNKVYSIKNYIPRIQVSHRRKTSYYAALRDSNYYEDKNPLPFNKARFRLPLGYVLLCLLTKLIIELICRLNKIIITISDKLNKLTKLISFGFWDFALPCVHFGAGLTDSDDDNTVFYPCCNNDDSLDESDCPDEMEGCNKKTSKTDLFDLVEELLAQEYHVVHLDFYNDWLNGVLYFPLWYWKKKRKRSFLFGLIRKRAINTFCNNDKKYSRLRLFDTCTIMYEKIKNDNGNNWVGFKKTTKIVWGVIKNIVNKDGLNLYYYSCGNILDSNPKQNANPIAEGKEFARLYATDIILLGSFNDCDLDGVPQLYKLLPSTTANIPNIASYMLNDTDDEDDTTMENSKEDEGKVEITGMDWMHGGSKDEPRYKRGLLFGLDCTDVYTKPKTCINLNRLCELGVNLDMRHYEEYKSSDNVVTEIEMLADGIITKVELDDIETRAMFATLNHNGLDVLKKDPRTNYDIYDFRYNYPVDFDGKYDLQQLTNYEIYGTFDIPDDDYRLFRYGNDFLYGIVHCYGIYGHTVRRQEFSPLYNNSFYFYFGLYEGKTAIDMFNKKFNADCYNNIKRPFNLNITTVSPKTCIYDYSNCDKVGSRCGVIDIHLDDIQMPYSYKIVKKATEETIIEESNMKLQHLVIGATLAGNNKYRPGHDYTCLETEIGFALDNNFHYFKNYPKIAETTYFEDGEQKTKAIEIENTTYTITITDVNGHSVTEDVTLYQNPIELLYTYSGLSTKFYPQEEEGIDPSLYTSSCDIYHKNYDGRIDLTGIIIDGDEYDIINVVYKGFGGHIYYTPVQFRQYEIYILTVQGKKDGTIYDVELKMGVRKLIFEDDLRFKDGKSTWQVIHYSSSPENLSVVDADYISDPITAYHNHPSCGIKTSGFDAGTIWMRIWVPGHYEFVLTQMCCGKLTDNTSSTIIRIQNGQPFDAYINEVPVRFVEKSPKIQDNLFTNTTQPLQPWSNGSDALIGWLQVNNENVYNFPRVDYNQVLWEEYIEYNVLRDSANQKVCDDFTKLHALLFKFNSLFRLSHGTFVSDDSSFVWETTGGKNVIKQAYCPSYEDIPPMIIDFNDEGSPNYMQFNRWSCMVDTAQVTNDGDNPNIVGFNLKEYHRCNKYKIPNHGDWPYQSLFVDIDNTIEQKGEPSFNPLIDDGVYGSKMFADPAIQVNYFVAVTNNGEEVYERFPRYPQTKLLKNGSTPLEFYNKANLPDSYIETLKYWFRTEFVDRRLSHKTVYITSSPNIKDVIDPFVGDYDISKGRFMSQINGGIELAYDEDYNIISTSNEFEYTYCPREIISGVGDVKTTLNISDTKKYFYESTLFTNFKNFDIVKTWYNKDKDFTADGYAEINEKDIAPRVKDYIKPTNYDELKVLYANYYYDGSKKDRFKTSRYSDICNLDIYNYVTFKTQSCSYGILASAQFHDNNTEDAKNANIVAYTKGGEVLGYTVGCASCFGLHNGNIDDFSETGNFNVLYQSDETDYVTEATYKQKWFRSTFNLTQDNLCTEEYKYTSYRPLLVPFKTIDEIREQICKWKFKIDPKLTYEKVHKYVEETYASNVWKLEIVKKPDEIKIYDDWDRYKYFYANDNHKNVYLHSGNEDNFKDIILKTHGQSLYLSNDDDIPQMMYWTYKTDEYYGSTALKIKDYKGLLLLGGREYESSNQMSHLEKTIKVFNFSDLYVFDSIIISDMSVTVSGQSSLSSMTISGNSESSGGDEDSDEGTDNNSGTTTFDIPVDTNNAATYLTLKFNISGVPITVDTAMRGRVWYSFTGEDNEPLDSTLAGDLNVSPRFGIIPKNDDENDSEEDESTRIIFESLLDSNQYKMLERHIMHVQLFFMVGILVYGLSFKVKSNEFLKNVTETDDSKSLSETPIEFAPTK